MIGFSWSAAAAATSGGAWPFVACGSRVHSQNPVRRLQRGSGFLGPQGVRATAGQAPCLVTLSGAHTHLLPALSPPGTLLPQRRVGKL